MAKRPHRACPVCRVLNCGIPSHDTESRERERKRVVAARQRAGYRPYSSAERREQFPHVDLSILTDHEAAIIQLHWADGWTWTRISRAFDCDESTVRYHYKRAIHVLASRDSYCLGIVDEPSGSRIHTPVRVEAREQAPATDEA